MREPCFLSLLANIVMAWNTHRLQDQVDRASADPSGARIRGKVDIVEHLGDETVVNVLLPSGASVLAIVGGDAFLKPGDAIGLTFDVKRAHLFQTSGPRLVTTAPQYLPQ